MTPQIRPMQRKKRRRSPEREQIKINIFFKKNIGKNFEKVAFSGLSWNIILHNYDEIIRDIGGYLLWQSRIMRQKLLGMVW